MLRVIDYICRFITIGYLWLMTLFVALEYGHDHWWWCLATWLGLVCYMVIPRGLVAAMGGRWVCVALVALSAAFPVHALFVLGIYGSDGDGIHLALGFFSVFTTWLFFMLAAPEQTGPMLENEETRYRWQS